MGKILSTICGPLSVISTVAELILAVNKAVNAINKIYNKRKK